MQERTKYPRTFHLPFSPGATSDDKMLVSTDCFKGKKVIVTEKLDGENCSMYSDYIHARSIDGRYHPSRDWCKTFHASFKHEIPIGDRICGENLYAQHSIAYDNLKSFFYGFSYWVQDLCLDYDNTLMIFDVLGIVSPDILYRGVYDESILLELAKTFPTDKKEGFVVRNADSFHIDDFQTNVAKWVRKGHVETDDHWMTQQIIPNKLCLSQNT